MEVAAKGKAQKINVYLVPQVSYWLMVTARTSNGTENKGTLALSVTQDGKRRNPDSCSQLLEGAAQSPEGLC